MCSDSQRKLSYNFILQHSCTWTACIILATSTLVFPFTGFPLTPVISSPAASVPSRAAGVLSKTCKQTENNFKNVPKSESMLINYVMSYHNW